MLGPLSGLIGFCLFLSGIALISVGPVAVQPILPAAALYLLMALASRPALSLRVVTWMLVGLAALALSTLFSPVPGYSVLYFLLQSLPLILFGLVFGLMLGHGLSDRAQVRWFLSGFVVGAAVSSAVSILQFGTSTFLGFELSFTNNANFALVAPKGRGVGFTPEAALLAILLIPAVALVYGERGRTDSVLPAPLRGLPMLGLLALGLLSTRSSAMVLLPVILLLVDLVRSGDMAAFLKRLGALAVIAVALGAVFVQLYSARLQRNDAQASTTYRLEKILAGLDIFTDHPLVGAGLGRVSDPAFFEQHVRRMADWNWLGEDQRKGIDSWTVRLMAEGGLLCLLAFYYPLFRNVVPGLRRSPAGRALLIVSIALLLMQALISGYRDQPYFLLPVIVFALATAGRPALGARASATPARPAPTLRSTAPPPAIKAA